MDGSGFPPYFWESSGSERQQRMPPLVSSAPVAGGMAPFTFPVHTALTLFRPQPMTACRKQHQWIRPTSLPTRRRLCLLPESSVPAVWDPTSAFSWLPASTQQPSGPATQWDDAAHWDDLVSSFQPTTARPPSTGSSEGDVFGDSYALSSGPPSSIPEDNDWSSRWSSSGSRPVSATPSSDFGDPSDNRPVISIQFLAGSHVHFYPTSPPSVSVEIGQWDGTNWTPADLPCVEADFHLADEAMDMDARLGWDFKPSNVRWLDPDVSSEVAEFPQGIRLTGKNKIYAFHRVTGCPSKFPFFRKRTGYLINLTDMKDMNPDSDVTVDQLIRDQDSHSWGRGTGARSKVDAYVPGSFFGLSGDVKIACRRAAPECGGVTACESLDPVFFEGGAAFHHSLQNWRCRGIHLDGTRCDGSICLRKLNTPARNKNYILLCSKRNEALTSGTVHSQVQILDHVSEELFVKVMNGERIVDEDDMEATCSRVVSGRTGAKGKSVCLEILTPAFNHHKNGLPYVAKVEPLTCDAKMHIYCPWETLHPELARMAIVVPLPEHGHSHPPPPTNKCPHAVAERYQVATYLADQEALSTEKRYLQSSLSRDGKRVIFGAHPKLLRSIHDLRTLDCDTTFKPVAGEMQIFEINGWLVAINECTHTFAAVTVMRVWMEVHDRAAYKTVWEEIQRLVLKLTKKQLKFKGLHKGGKILGLNSDMEAAPLLGFADACGATVDLEHVRPAVLADPQALLSFVLRICYSHFNRGIPKLLNHTSETRQRIFNLKYIKTREEVETFKAWIATLADPQGVLKRWWEHKLMHRWLLRGVIQCLSNIPLEQWNTMEATTNLGEAQHAWNNAQTGISMGVIESFKKYEELDIRRAEEIEVRKATGVSRTSRNEVTDRYANRTRRQSRVSERARGARAIDSTVAGLQTELSEVRGDLAVACNNAKVELSVEATQRVRELEDSAVDLEGKLKLAQAEAKSSSSGRVRARKAGASSTTNIPAPPVDRPAPVLGVTPVSLDLAAMRRASTRKRMQAESSAMPSISSNKRRKKLEDPLEGWVMQDPDTGEELTGKEWVERYPEEFEKRYKKDHQRYLDYLAQSVLDS
ncbi:hypothetical protein B0H14DRAFT_3572999 [Mycena olivaceomarginata]|nr:hypothetical protein B0H14DRAFT_3572999 [Mycena olivaceomarginata]